MVFARDVVVDLQIALVVVQIISAVVKNVVSVEAVHLGQRIVLGLSEQSRGDWARRETRSSEIVVRDDSPCGRVLELNRAASTGANSRPIKSAAEIGTQLSEVAGARLG